MVGVANITTIRGILAMLGSPTAVLVQVDLFDCWRRSQVGVQPISDYQVSFQPRISGFIQREVPS